MMGFKHYYQNLSKTSVNVRFTVSVNWESVQQNTLAIYKTTFNIKYPIVFSDNFICFEVTASRTKTTMCA